MWRWRNVDLYHKNIIEFVEKKKPRKSKSATESSVSAAETGEDLDGVAAQQQFEASAKFETSPATKEELEEIKKMAKDEYGFDCQCSNCGGWYSVWLRSQLFSFYGEWISVADDEDGDPDGWYCGLPECVEAARDAEEENDHEHQIGEGSEDDI